HRQVRRQGAGPGAGRKRLQLDRERCLRRGRKDMRVAEAQDLYQAQFEGLTRADDAASAPPPGRVRDMRRHAFAHFRSEGFRTTRDEEFGATPVAAIADTAFESARAQSETPTTAVAALGLPASVREQFTIPGLTTAADLVFVNGRFVESLSSI